MKPHSNHVNLRVFLGVALSPDLSRNVAELQHQIRDMLPNINWVRPGSIHLTLKFLGNVEKGMVEQVRTALEPIQKNQAPFTLEFHGLGVFPHIRCPRILWIGCIGDIPSLLNLVSRIEAVLEPLGFLPEEKPYHPHLTLARIKHDNSKVGSVLKQSGLLERPQKHLGTLPINLITLFQSELSPVGAEYYSLWAVPLNEDQAHFSTYE